MVKEKSQRELAEWSAGFGDGEGSIAAEVSKSTSSVGYDVSPRYNIGHSYQAGFVDGEGSLSAKVRRNEDSVLDHSVAASFSIKHTEYDEVVEHLTTFCDEIGVDYTVRYAKKENENHSDQFIFRISKRGDLKKYLTELKPHLVLKKPQADIMLDEIMPRLDRNEHTNRRGFLRVMYWVDKLNERKGGLRGKYNLEYFEDLWGMRLDR